MMGIKTKNNTPNTINTIAHTGRLLSLFELGTPLITVIICEVDEDPKSFVTVKVTLKSLLVFNSEFKNS
jgi:hypothetical protein